ncbi:1-phosphatidylinositol 4,5-bisphosphate phosphodiesterase eta-2 [Hoplias malabaricus]|uniref:1-phosphatidylinositol 4,5-bisphosphate phosphodiesterase eta-2 n=1 Tax=Hoplias malabaricus TaxID=27720 RepID=UPI00346260A2
MNAPSAMAPLSPVTFSPISQSWNPNRLTTPALMSSPKLWQKASISRLAEEFFWIGGSIVATPKWRMGQFVERCMCTMQAGTQMIKLRGKSKTLVRFFYLDEHRSCIRWRPSRKRDKAKISIDSIHEVCEGKKTEMFQHFSSSNFDANCCFSIYHGGHVESLDLVTTNSDEARTWITGLKYLMAGISDEDSLARRQRTRDQWLRQTFSEADKNGDGNLSIREVLQLLHKLNVNLPRQKVRELFEEADTGDNQGCLTFMEFCNFYKIISTRQDLYLIMLMYSHRKEYMDINDFIRFLESEQKMVNVSREYCQMIVNQFEPCQENRAHLVLGIDGFTNFMRSPAGDIFNPEHYQVNQDMTQPLTNYYIASSHNTYLTGDQLLSQSRADMYAYVLQAGCRCVEVDCWDGPDGEPIVHHGYTLTSKILFRDVMESINKYAFAKSQYPVIISIENHCSVPQQKKMAQYLTEVLQEKLDLSSVNVIESCQLPSPEILKGKILVKGKKLPANIDDNAEEGDVSDEDSGEEEEEEINEEVIKRLTSMAVGAEASEETKNHLRRFMGSFRQKKKKRMKFKKRLILSDSDTDHEIFSSNPNKVINYGKRRKTMRLSRALSDLVKYTKSVRVHDIETQAYMSSWQVSSLNERISNQILQFKPCQFVRFNQRQLLRVYPSNYRVDSSNFNPQTFWNAGCHLVALNYQTEGRMLQLNRAKFAANGNCGYVLKPKCMCKGAFNPMLSDPLPGHRRTQLVLKIISGQQLPKPKDSMLGDRGEIIDPFVEVEIIGLPVDCHKEQTRVVDDNGFNPMWEETLVFTLHLPKIALVRFMVWDHDPIGRDFIGQRTIAFTSMLPGYRHVYLEGMEEASIFVHVAINDITGKNKSSNAVKQLIQKNLRQTSEDGTRTSFTPNFLRKSDTGKGQGKASQASQESYNQDDFLNRRYSDDVNSQCSRTASQNHSLNRGAQSELLKRSHWVCFQESDQRLVTRSCLSSTNSCGETEKPSNYISLKFSPGENPEGNSAGKTERSKLNSGLSQTHLFSTDRGRESGTINTLSLGITSNEKPEVNVQVKRSDYKLRPGVSGSQLSNCRALGKKTNHINLGFDSKEKPEVSQSTTADQSKLKSGVSGNLWSINTRRKPSPYSNDVNLGFDPRENPEVRQSFQTDQSKLRFGIARCNLSNTNSNEATGKISDYINFGFDPRENPEVSQTFQTDQSKLKAHLPRSHLSNIDSSRPFRKITNDFNLEFNPRDNPQTNRFAQTDQCKPRLTGSLLSTTTNCISERNTGLGFDTSKESEINPNRSKLSHQDYIISTFSDLMPVPQLEYSDSDGVDSFECKIKMPASQHSDRPSLSKQFFMADKDLEGPELKSEKNRSVPDQQMYSSSRQWVLKDVGSQGTHAYFEFQPILDQNTKTCAEIWTPKGPGVGMFHQKEWKSLKFDPKLDRYPNRYTEQWMSQSLGLTTGKSGFGLKSSVDIQMTLSNESFSTPATPAMNKCVLHNQGRQSFKESPSKFQRSCSVPKQQPLSPPNSPHNFRTDVWKYILPPNKTGPVTQEYSAPIIHKNYGLPESDSSSQSSLNSLDPSTLPSRFPESQQQTVGTLQREMNALFEQKIREIHSHSPLLFSDHSTL